ncbi:MAG TPA: tripartite tricarboxylate transporter substrate-binding protein [Burkholderiales bacterium]|nr:tripartite tricarboxylate transporter substrate-binding protein [Burkholderiales bacterium]
MRVPQGHTVAIALVTSVALEAAPCISQAQQPSGQPYPARPIRLVASTTPASQPDMIARTIAQKMSESWGRPVVMDNRPGAGGTLAAGMVAKATPDGHTILYALPNFVISTALQPSLPYEALKDFACITQIGFSTNVLVVTPSLGVKSVKELIALAKTQPGKIVFASSATGSASHLSGARFNLLAGIKVVHVAFKGGPDATIEVLAGRAHYHVGTMGVVLPFIKEGKLVPLALTTPQRTAVLPDVPALAETLPEFKRPETSHALLAPAGTPRAIVSQLNKEVTRIIELPDVKERLQAISFVTTPTTSDDCASTLRTQMETLSKVASDAGLRPR